MVAMSQMSRPTRVFVFPLTFLIVALTVAITGCVTMESTPEPEKEEIQTTNFSFTPLSQATPGSSGVTFLQIKPQFIETFAYPQVEPFSNFATSMESDVQELLAARGFTARGTVRND